MVSSINFRVMGIQIELHWSLLVLLLLIFAYDGIDAVLTMGILLTFVILHELSHSYIAIRNGVKVRKITLFPIGGMAMIEDVSVSPDVEFKLAIAGPLFNFAVIAFSLPFYLLVNYEPVQLLFSLIIEINLVLGVFNLLPAIPLDGGRVWRSLREKKVGHLRATIDAVRLSRFAVIMLLSFSAIIAFSQDAFGLLIWNSIISAVIYFGSQAELNVAILKDSARGILVRDATSFSPVCVESHNTLKDAFSLMYSTHSPTIVVLGSPPKLLGYRQLSRVVKGKWGRVRAVDVAQPSPSCELDEPILDAWKKMKAADVPLLPVLFNGELVGTISEIDIEKLLVLNRLRLPED